MFVCACSFVNICCRNDVLMDGSAGSIKWQGHIPFTYHPTTMNPLPFSSLQTMARSPILSSALRRTPIVSLSKRCVQRHFSNRMPILQGSSRRLQTPLSFFTGSRTLMTERPIVQEATAFSWGRFAVTAVSTT